jgi:hypothetical protein
LTRIIFITKISQEKVSTFECVEKHLEFLFGVENGQIAAGGSAHSKHLM